MLRRVATSTHQLVKPLVSLTSRSLKSQSVNKTNGHKHLTRFEIESHLLHAKAKQMAVNNGGATEKNNDGVVLSSSVVEDENPPPKGTGKGRCRGELREDATLLGVLNHLIKSIVDPDEYSGMADRMKKSVMEAAPMFRQAILNTRRDLLLWTRDGSSLRALLVVSAGIVVSLGLTGLVGFMLFFVAATVNAVVISCLISVAAVGGFLAIFFACFTTFYIAILFIAAFITFTVTISSIIAALFAAGWIGFFWMTWLAVSKGASLAKRSFGHSQAYYVSKEQ